MVYTQWHRTAPQPYKNVPAYDCVIITQKYPDHYHEVTLQKLQPKKIIVPASITKKVKRLLPQSEVLCIENMHEAYSINSCSLVWFKTARKIDPIYDAILLSGKNESIMIATHSFTFSEKQLQQLETYAPVCVLCSPCNLYKLPFFLGGTVAPGIEGLKKLVAQVKPKYIVATHDEDKYAKGIVDIVAKKIRYSPEELKNMNEFKNKFIDISNYEPYHF